MASGEIVGLYGLMGAGRTELLQTLIGEEHALGGEIHVDGARVDQLPIQARIDRGLFLVPEDRQRQGLVSALSVKQNISLASLGELSILGALQLGRESNQVSRLTKDVGVKTRNIDESVTSLSGGNQQKVVVTKALMTDPKVLLMDDPMRGVDIGAKAEIYRIMKRLAGQGIAIVFTSSDLVEVLGMADRIVVMARGRITAEFSRETATSQALIAASNPRAVAEVAA